jgi:hypothetical protein
MSQSMKKIKHFTVRFLIAMVLIAIFVVQGSIWSNNRSHAAQSNMLVNSIDTQLAQRQQKKTKNIPKKIDYELIIKDIVDIFRAMESTGTGTAMIAKINGSPQECSRDRCDIELTNFPSNTFSGLKSKKYISSIEISTWFNNSDNSSAPSNNIIQKNPERISYIKILLKDLYREVFSPSQFNTILSGENPPRPKLQDVECNSFSPPCSYSKGTYINSIHAKYFPEPCRNKYNVITSFYRYKTGKESLYKIMLSKSNPE